MSGLLGVVSAVFWGLLVLSLLVFVHEGGHYLAARACGVRVTEFFLGLPCPVRLSRKSRSHGTEIGVTPLLLGGYTRICGMEGGEDELLAEALACVQRHGRVEVAALAREMGCDTDRAYKMMATLADWAAIEPFYDSTKGERPGQRDWPAAFQTLKRDANLRTEYDRDHDFSGPGVTGYGEPREVPGSARAFLEGERARTYLGCGFWKRVGMLVAGPAVNLVLALVLVMGVFMFVGQEQVTGTNVLGGVTEGSIAAQTGLEAGDRVTQVDGQDTPDWTSLVAAIQAKLGAGEDFSVTFERDGQTRTVQVDLPEGESVELLGVYEETETYYATPAEAFLGALRYAGLVASYAVKLIIPQHTMEVLDSSSSVVGISVMASQAATQGAGSLVQIVAAISMSLGFMNLLPIPPLDGGKVLIELIQVGIRRQLSPKAQVTVSYIGLAFFIFVFTVALRNDIARLMIG